MAERWRDDDRFDRGDRGGYTNERMGSGRSRGEYGAYGGYGDYDRDSGSGSDWRGQNRDQRSAYSDWNRPDDRHDYDQYTRSSGARRNEGRSSFGDSGYGYGYEGNRYGSDDPNRLTHGGYGSSRTAYPSRGYDDRSTGRGRLDGLRGFRTSGYNFDEGDDGRTRYRSDRDERGWLERAGDELRSWFGDDDAERRRMQDQHRGRGPKGYSRSDERIREDVCDRLSDDWRIDASDIEVQVKDGEVTLTGTVSDRQLKRRVEDVVDDVSGVRNVQNSLRVQQQQWGSSSSGTAGASQSGGLTGGQSATGTSGTVGTSGSTQSSLGTSKTS